MDDFYVARMTSEELRNVLLHQPNPRSMDMYPAVQEALVHLLRRWLATHSDIDCRHLFLDDHGNRDVWMIAYVDYLVQQTHASHGAWMKEQMTTLVDTIPVVDQKPPTPALCNFH